MSKLNTEIFNYFINEYKEKHKESKIILWATKELTGIYGDNDDISPNHYTELKQLKKNLGNADIIMKIKTIKGA